jgi:hypothetical protein
MRLQVSLGQWISHATWQFSFASLFQFTRCLNFNNPEKAIVPYHCASFRNQQPTHRIPAATEACMATNIKSEAKIGICFSES